MGVYIHLYVNYVKHANMEGFAEIVTYVIHKQYSCSARKFTYI